MAQQEELERRAEELSSVAYKPLVIILVDFSHRNQFVSWIIPEMLLMKLWFIEQCKGLNFINKCLYYTPHFIIELRETQTLLIWGLIFHLCKE